MSKVCPITGKRAQSGFNVSHSQRHTKRKWQPNLVMTTVIDERGRKMSAIAGQWLAQRDLPEQMRPYQANAIEADAQPSTGWWKAGTFVRNRNCTGTGTPFGWICTASGKPGTWCTVEFTFE